ncbi:hypothetical protein EZV62_027620 [Acer yangbiense]|uniref:Protein kinase domain-containing protein n=1 Tax=Acer yangbiense TaxID=1000413 RepID=A0A5C7GW64_9ROSI|nr:hypothetical protein EZV62_027620 [Acer yangbiense]
MERNLGKGAMDQHKNHEQVRYNNMETRTEGPGSANQRFFHDPSGNINTNIRPPDYTMSVGARPVLNYSIQTGEEFSLEFMRDRVIPRQHFVPNAYGDPNNMPVYMDLKGVRGISHTGSESGSEITMRNTADAGHAQEFERKGTSTHEDRNYFDSVRSVPRTSSRNEMSRGLQGYASSGVSDNSSTKVNASSGVSDNSSTEVKFLCSFGGKILPRPSDGKLRYVGGETRIIRISRDISWQELMRKVLAIYSQTHTIKYQLPGEDLDALVSVSCDEDLQNMMEECNVLEDRGSQKPRMFLFSNIDLEDEQLGMESIEGDSEIQFVIAVNGMDLGSRKNSIALGSASGNNLDELLSLKVERETGRVAAESALTSTTNLTSNAPLSTIKSSLPVLASSTSVYDSNSQPYQGQKMQYVGQHLSYTLHPTESFHQIDVKSTTPLPVPLQYGYGSHPSNYATRGENVAPVPLPGQMNQQGDLAEERYGGFRADDPEVFVREAKLKIDGSTQKINEPEKIRTLDKEASIKDPKMKRDGSLPKISDSDRIQMSENEYVVPSHPYTSSVTNYMAKEEASARNSSPDISSSLLSSKISKKAQEPVLNSTPPEAVNEGKKNNDDDHFYASGGAFTSGYGDSEAELTDVSYHEPSVIPQRIYHSEQIPREQAEMNRLSKSDDSFGAQFLISQAHTGSSQPILESIDKLPDRITTSETEQSITSAKPQHTNPQTSQFESNLRKSEKDHYMDDKAAAGSHDPTVHHGTSSKQPEDSALRASDYEWSEMATNKNNGNDTKERAQPLASKENPVRAVPRGDSVVGAGTPEKGDIVIDINDRFPRDFLSDIFSKAVISENRIDMTPMHGDGAVLSWNMENHDPKHWSYFRNMAQDEFVRKDVSLMDQDHLGFSSPLTNIKEGVPVDYSYPPLKSDGVALAHVDSHINFDEDIQRDSSGIVRPNSSRSQLKGDESVQLETVNPRIPESDYKEGRLDVPSAGSPLADLPLGDFDITTLQIIKNEDLEEFRELGSGTFGTVYHGKWRGTDVAIKRIKKSCFTGRSSEQERLTVEFWREAEILSKLHHPNVVAFYGVVQDGPGGTLATVTEFMVNGSLRHVLLSKDRHLDRRKRLIIAMDAAFGMEYLHSKNIVHFDLKCDNLLVNLKDPSRPICKVGDFGLSKIKRNTLVTGGVRGTLPWMAPELLNGSSSKVSEKVDVFSFGIVLWEILTGEEPYANMHYGAIIGLCPMYTGGIVNNTLRPLVPPHCDAEWRLLMEQCWAPDPVVRPSFTEIASRLRVMSVASRSHGHQPQNQVAK